MVFFPTDSFIEEGIERLKPLELARLFWSSRVIDNSRIIGYQRTFTVCVDLRNPRETLFAGIAKNNRYEIRQVEKLDDRVRVDRNQESILNEFLLLYNEFARLKDRVSPITSKVLQRYLNNADVFVIYLDGTPMGGHVYLRDSSIGRARLLYSASRRLNDQAAARTCGMLNRYVHWHAICTYRDEGFELYDLGGVRDDENDGIARFKKSFGGKVVQEHNYLFAGSRWIGGFARTVFDMGRNDIGRRHSEVDNQADKV